MVLIFARNGGSDRCIRKTFGERKVRTTEWFGLKINFYKSSGYNPSALGRDAFH